jgi:EpsI family protein
MISLYQYLNQVPGAELVSSGEAWRADRAAWRLLKEDTVDLAIEGKDISIDEAELVSTSGQPSLLVWTWYRVGNEYTANPYRVKLLEATQVLFEGGRAGSRFFLAAPIGDDKDASRRTMEAFVQDHLERLEGVLDTR